MIHVGDTVVHGVYTMIHGVDTMIQGRFTESTRNSLIRVDPCWLVLKIEQVYFAFREGGGTRMTKEGSKVSTR